MPHSPGSPSRKFTATDLTPSGVVSFCQIYLRRNELGPAAEALASLPDDYFVDCPYLYLLRGGIRIALALPKPEQTLVLTGLPLDIRRAHTIRPDAEVATELDAAAADLQRVLPLAIELGLKEAPRLIRSYVIWSGLLHPGRKETALAQLRRDMQEPPKALPLIQFALAYDPDFNAKAFCEYLKRRERLGGLNDEELRASLPSFAASARPCPETICPRLSAMIGLINPNRSIEAAISRICSFGWVRALRFAGRSLRGDSISMGRGSFDSAAIVFSVTKSSHRNRRSRAKMIGH